MKIVQDERFRQQRQEFKLRFTCEHCSLFDDERQSCAHGYPTTEHREARYADPDAQVVFCKHFELA
ncbi:MAG TPA: hypothetical protein VF331_08590 [Polyangiales bacterium]